MDRERHTIADAVSFAAEARMHFKNAVYSYAKRVGIPEHELKPILRSARISGYVGTIAQVAYAVYEGDPRAIEKAVALAAIGLVTSGVISLMVPNVFFAGLIASIVNGYIAHLKWEDIKKFNLEFWIRDHFDPLALDFLLRISPVDIEPRTNRFYNTARSWNRRDPLAIDLDRDGIETVGTDGYSTVLFDHDGDGRRSGTGWVARDDGLLVLDRNGNGRIDSGAELFGIDTVKSNGQRATDGFDALRDLDANHDGVLDARDPRFAEVRIWQDRDQDGVTDPGELSTLTERGILAIDLHERIHVHRYANGNQQTAESTYRREDGTTGTLGTLELVDNPFYRTFPAEPLDPGIAALPDMRGSGAVRDLREAAQHSPMLADLLRAFAAAPTRTQQRALLEPLLLSWSETAAMPTSVERAASSPRAYRLIYLLPGQSAADYDPLLPYWQGGLVDDPTLTLEERRQLLERLHERKAEQQRITRLIGILERFNGLPFVEIGDDQVTTGDGTPYLVQHASVPHAPPVGRSDGPARLPGPPRVYVPLSPRQVQALQDAYTTLKESVYAALVVQTRLRPYLEGVQLTVDAEGVHLDFSGLDARLAEAHTEDGRRALVDLIELHRYAGRRLIDAGWDGLDLLRDWIHEMASDPELPGLLAELRAWQGSGSREGSEESDLLLGLGEDDQLRGRGGADLLAGGGGEDVLLGGEGEDTLVGGPGADRLLGGEGGDWLLGQAGDDVLAGGPGDDWLAGGRGDDVLTGGPGDDTYYFPRGWGRDRIDELDTAPGKRDRIRFGAGIAPESVEVRRDGMDLVLSRRGTGDEVRVNWFFYHDAEEPYHRVEEVRFADGTVWDVAEVKQRVLQGTEAAQWLVGYATDDFIYGAGGDDEIRGEGGRDFLAGGPGADRLLGGEGGDWLLGQAGDDLLAGGPGDDWLAGGRGDDVLTGGPGDDTYYFPRGWGRDRIDELETAPGKRDRIRFGAGIAPESVEVRRDGMDLVLSRRGTGDEVRVNWFFYHDAEEPYHRVEEVRFADGTVWDVAEVKRRVLQGTEAAQWLVGYATDDFIYGAGGDDEIRGEGGRDFLAGGPGADRLLGGEGGDWLLGQAGDDVLAGGPGDDWLAGGRGDDVLIGGPGDDTYYFPRGWGRDRVEARLGEGARDRIRFDRTVASDQLWFARDGLDLCISLLGTSDRIRIRNWYLGEDFRVGAIQAGDGRVLFEDQVERLVQAMAGFAPPPAGSLHLSPDLHEALAPVLAASWQPAS